MNEPISPVNVPVGVCMKHAIQYTGEFCPFCGPTPEPVPVPCGVLKLHSDGFYGDLVIPCQRPQGHVAPHLGLSVRGDVILWSDPPTERENQ